MPFTFNGIGTSLYGARDFWPNGSHITTEWFVFIYIPVVPLKSIRIVPTGKSKNYVVYSSAGYVILEKAKLNLRQVFSVYGWFAVVAGSFWATAEWEIWWLAIPGVLALGAPWFLRRRAIKRMMKEWERRKMGLPVLDGENTFCTRCGVALTAGAVFCSSCGQRG